MTIFLHNLQIFPVVLSVIESCQPPNPLQWGIIIGLVATTGLVAVVAAGVTVASIATTLVTMIMASSSIETIAAAITGDVATGGGLTTIIAGLVVSIRGILGC